MFQLRKRERTTMGANSTNKPDILSSQSTMELSFSSDMDSSEEDGLRNSSCVVVSDSESDTHSCEGPSTSSHNRRQDNRRSIRGGLRRSSKEVRKNLKVTFSQVHVRTYGICVGDNPAVSLGVPISMDWKVTSEDITTVNAYDAAHPTGKSEQQLAIPSCERERMVRRAGFSTEDIRSAVRQVNSTKMERENTIDTLQNASQEEFMEKLKKGIWNATFSRKSKKTERAILQKLKENDAKRILVSPAC